LDKTTIGDLVLVSVSLVGIGTPCMRSAQGYTLRILASHLPVRFALDHEDQVPNPNALHRGKIVEKVGQAVKKMRPSSRAENPLAQTVKCIVQIHGIGLSELSF